MRIAGSLWSVPEPRQAARLTEVVTAGLPVAHWDASDGVFAAAGGFTPVMASRLLADVPTMESEAHLMMHDPLLDLPGWAEFCTTIVVPIEVDTAARAVDRISALGAQPALAVSLGTSLDQVPGDLPVLLMAITPGQAGSALDPAVVHRVEELSARGRNPLIGVDGGVESAHFDALAAAGANWIVSGTDLFTTPSPGEWISRCRAAFR